MGEDDPVWLNNEVDTIGTGTNPNFPNKSKLSEIMKIFYSDNYYSILTVRYLLKFNNARELNSVA